MTKKSTSMLLLKCEVDAYDDAMKPSDALRAAVKNSGQTRYRIARQTGMTESGLSRFVHGGGLNLASLDRLAGYLGLELVPTRTQVTGKALTKAKPQKRKG